jgi:hypothetical protein
MAYVTLLTSTDCAFRPVTFRNYDLMPSKRWEGSFWVHRAGLGAAISVWVGSYIMLALWWRRCVSLLTNPGTPYSGTNSVNETHLNTMTSQFRPAFLKLHSEKPWSSVRYVRVSPREFSMAAEPFLFAFTDTSVILWWQKGRIFLDAQLDTTQ